MPIYELGGQMPQDPGEGRYYIADTAVVIGRVRLKVDASVWFGAVLRGDNELIEIGERSNIQDNCILHTDPGYPLTVGRDCTIGHSANLHGCRVGDHTLIGIGAILLNGSKIGKNCLVGAGTLVPARVEFSDNAVIVGTPGRQVRNIDEDTTKLIARSAETYVKRWQQYRQSLKRIG